MSRRRLHILVALLCTGLWAGAIWLGHTQRPSAVSRPARVGIVRCANAGARRQGAAGPRHDRCDRRHHRQTRRHLSAAARGDRQDRRGDRAAGAEGHRDRSPAGRQGTRRRRCGARESARGESDRAGGGGGVFRHRSAFRRERRAAGPPAEGRPLPAAAAGICRPRGSRHRQCDDGPDRHAAIGPDAVPDTRQDRTVVSASCRVRRDRQEADDRARPPAVRRPLDRDRFRLCAADFLLRPAPHHSHRQRRKSGRRPDRQGGHSGPDRRPRRDRNRRRRFLSDAVRFTDAGRGNHFHRHYASGGGRRHRARSAGSHRRCHHGDPAPDAAGRLAGVAAKRGRPARRSAR